MSKDIALKAYRLNTNNLDSQNESIQRGYLHDAYYGKTEHEARKSALKDCYEHGIEETYLDEPLTYVNIRIKRFPEMDKYLVDGKLKTQYKIDQDNRLVEHENKIRQMLVDHPNGYAYIRKGGYFYCANYCGYTERYENAGVYPIADAVSHCLGMSLNDYMRPEVVNIETHNKMINDKISQLKSNLL